MRNLYGKKNLYLTITKPVRNKEHRIFNVNNEKLDDFLHAYLHVYVQYVIFCPW